MNQSMIAEKQGSLKFPKIKNLPSSKHHYSSKIDVNNNRQINYSSLTGTNKAYVKQILDEESRYDEIDNKFICPYDTISSLEISIGIKSIQNDNTSPNINKSNMDIETPPLSPNQVDLLNIHESKDDSISEYMPN